MSRAMKGSALVIGGAGFLGSHVADALTESGYEVCIYDRVQSQYLRNNQRMILGSIEDEASLLTAMSGVDYVFHLAAIADIASCNNNPMAAIESNILGSARVFESCFRSKVQKIIFASSVYVYSDSGGFYRATKQASETLLREYAKKFDQRYSILRYGSLYGPRSPDWNGLKQYIRTILKNEAIIYKGTGEEKREYIHIADAALMTVDAIDSRYDGQCLLLTGQESLSSRDVLQLIFEIIGLRENIKFNVDAIDSAHYRTTPYKFEKQRAIKINPTSHVDFGQGILEMIQELTPDEDHQH